MQTRNTLHRGSGVASAELQILAAQTLMVDYFPASMSSIFLIVVAVFVSAPTTNAQNGLQVDLCTSLEMRGGQVRIFAEGVPIAAEPRTVSAWIKPDCRTATELLRGLHNVVSWGHSNFVAERFSLMHAGGCTGSRFAGGCTETDDGCDPSFDWTGLPGPNADGWSHLVLTYDEEQNMAFFLDGEAASGPVARELATWNVDAMHPVVVGGDSYPGTGEPFLGLIKRVRIWNRALRWATI